MSEFDKVSFCPEGWSSGLRFDPEALWIHKDGRQFVAISPRPNGGNLLLVSPEEWRNGWTGAAQVWPDGFIGTVGPEEMHISEFVLQGSCSL